MTNCFVKVKKNSLQNSHIEQIVRFQKILKNAQLVAPIRKTRGNDVLAACGQLKSDSKREKTR
jgi:23S rRNA (adenine2503-C2)-methyltransferase